jgi:hypothetical protein
MICKGYLFLINVTENRGLSYPFFLLKRQGLMNINNFKTIQIRVQNFLFLKINLYKSQNINHLKTQNKYFCFSNLKLF